MPVLRIGPVNLPSWVLVSAGALAALIVLRRLLRPGEREIWSKSDDLLTSAVGLGFIVWKLAPLVTRTAEIVDAPLRLLYYPGGILGLIAGIAAATAFLLIAVFRRRPESPLGRSHLAHGLLLLGVLALGPVTNAAVAAVIAPEEYEIEADELDFLQGGMLVDDEQPTVLVFWATWCGPCTAQMPELARFWATSGDHVNLIAVNLIETEAGSTEVTAYLARAGLGFPVALDYGGRLSRYLGVAATPTTVILDPEGIERFRRTGAVSSANLQRRLLPYVR